MFPLTTTGEGSYANGRGEEVAVKGRDEGWKGGRVEGREEMEGDGKEMEPGEEKAKRMQTHISWKDCKVPRDRTAVFWQQREFTSVQTIFFLLASGFLFFFGARVRVE